MRELLDIKQAKHFVELLNHSLYTFIYLKNGKPKGVDTWERNKINWRKLATLNTKHQTEIFVMINEGDGVIYPPNKTPRSQKNVIRLTSFFIDTDDCPFNEVKSFLKDRKLVPHLIVQTSPKKYHLYFFASIPETQGDITQPLLNRWKHVQRQLAYLDQPLPQCDESTQDSSRVLRVPGFLHLKNPDTPFLTRIEKEYTHSPYTLDELEAALEGCQPIRQAAAPGDTPSGTRYSLPQQKVEKGNRHLEITRFLGHLLTQGVSKEIVDLSYTQFANTFLENPSHFLPGGKRYNEVNEFIEWKLAQQQHESTEEREKAKAAAKKALSTSLNSPDDPFALPNEFYLDTPGLLGEMTKFIYDTAAYPSAPIAFASSLSLLGLLRSKCQVGPRGGTPNNYIMCLAPSGSGKSHAQTILNNSLSALSLPKLLQFGVRSEKGVLKFLEHSSSRGLYILDEGETFFTGFQNSKLPHYLLAVRTLFLELYSSANSATKIMGQTGNEKEKPIVLNYPHLSLLAFGVLHTISEAFTEKTIKDGLLQRFLIVTSTGKRQRNDNAIQGKAFPEHILRELRQIAIRNSQTQETTDENGAQLLTPPQKIKRYTLHFTEEATEAFDTFSLSLDNKINDLLDSGIGYPELYTRAAEQTERLLTAAYTAEGLGGAPVTYQQYRHMETFVESRINALEAIVAEGLKGDLTRYDRQDNEIMDRIRSTLAEHQARTGLGVSVSALWEKMVPKPSYRVLKNAVKDGIEMGILSQRKVTAEGRGRPSTIVQLA